VVRGCNGGPGSGTCGIADTRISPTDTISATIAVIHKMIWVAASSRYAARHHHEVLGATATRKHQSGTGQDQPSSEQGERAGQIA
jgi:hypothetical protein